MDCVDVDLLTACQVNPMLSALYGKLQLLLQQIVPKRRRCLALHALWQPCMRGPCCSEDCSAVQIYLSTHPKAQNTAYNINNGVHLSLLSIDLSTPWEACQGRLHVMKA